jgi:hypothetical protein
MCFRPEGIGHQGLKPALLLILNGTAEQFAEIVEFCVQPLKGHLISKVYVIAKAMT